ncbi:MAG: bifunctional diaminohydroxyphosphoribosylaminopyrimidine deaminase/5-amino-6-(5-phosphoribosylamino)uracil reductase RibD [Muribaculaceae bacterium]|nr:bifunctional diaminohydroxyphosphoribosylaminopyrimidine deaminase/5-amino-6-(5-phosphoribosylamino)uracil reductase RibD [Muribaculaceae bacterium]
MVIDEKYMRRALQLARLGAGHTSPNPMVGAVIVDSDGTIIGEGWHRKCGEAHAEVNAVASVKEEKLLKDSTLYVTLEPCSHYGKTPPCARLIIERGIPRVVVGCLDPFAKVSGRGVAMLREAGVEVTVGLLEQECRALNHRFMTAHTTGRPWVQLKWAQTADGFIALPPDAGENPLRMSTPATMCLMHRQRALCDAIVVGAATALIDNPSLTTRYWPGKSPLRVVLSRDLSVAGNLNLLSDGLPTIVYNGIRNEVCGAVEYVKMDTTNPSSWLEDLYRRGVTSVMVEGGAKVLQGLIDAHAWDEARVEVSPRRVGQGITAPLIDGCQEARYCLDGNIINVIRPSLTV